MDSLPKREPRVLWSFWLACGLAATGGIAPLVLTLGGTDRLARAVIPFAIAAIAMAIIALTYQQGRGLATALYFVAGFALVYAMLSMAAVPVLLQVNGMCPDAHAICPAGSEPPFSAGENSALAIGIAMGTLAILAGYFGLLTLYRGRRPHHEPPPTRREPPVAPAVAAAPGPSPSAASAPDAEPAAPMPVAPAPERPMAGPAVPAGPPGRASKPRVGRTPRPQAELAAPAEPLELPAPPAEPLELPAPSSEGEPPSDDSPAS